MDAPPRWRHQLAAHTGPPAPADTRDLDTRIQLAEQQLVAREQRLRVQVQGLGRRARRAAAPRTLLLKVAGGALAGLGVLWALRRAGGPGHPPDPPGAAAQAGAPPHLLLSLLPMAWPLLPARWRQRISPATAAAVLGVALPLVARLLAPRAASAGGRTAPPSVPHLDLLRFAGTWHELARLPAPFEHACTGQPQATTYTPRGGRLAVRNACRGAHGRLRVAEGVARVVPDSGGARLQVSFLPGWLQWLPGAWSDLWVLHVDAAAADYRVAIAGHPSRRALWLLSRSPQLPPDELQQLVGIARDLGYDTHRLVMADPAGPLP